MAACTDLQEMVEFVLMLSVLSCDTPLVEGCGELTPNRRASLWIVCNNCLYPQAEYSLGVIDIFCILSL